MKLRTLFFSLFIVILSFGNIALAADDDGVSSEQISTSESISEKNSELEKNEECDCFKRRIFVHGERRIDRPLRAHIVLTGDGLNRIGYNPGGGVHLEYQISNLIAIGLTSQAFYNDTNSWSDHNRHRYDYDNVYLGQEGANEAVTEIDPRHLLEVRFFPWNFGMYFSAGILHVGKQKSLVEFKKRDRIIGENEYNTGLTATLEYEAWTGGAAGVGYNYIFQSGLSLGVGFSAGFGILEPNVTVTSTSAVTTDDMDAWQEQIEENEMSIPHIFHFGIGYAF